MFNAKPIPRRSQALFALSVYTIAAVLAGVWDAGVHWWGYSVAQRIASSRKEVQTDNDLAQFLLPGLSGKHSFSETFAWWHGTWAGIVPFWRPVTSQLLWLEYHFFSPERFDYWFLVSALSHLVFVYLLWVFVSRLTGRTVLSALTVVIFAGGSSVSFFAWTNELLRSIDCGLITFDFVPPCLTAVELWKNQPEIWAGSLTLGAMILGMKRSWGGCLACIVTAICVKESGWLAFPLTLIALWLKGQLGTIPASVLKAGCASAFVLVVLRAASGWAVFYGYHYGENISWLTRYEHASLGCYFTEIIEPSSRAGALFGTLIVFVCLSSRFSFRVKVILAAACLFAASATVAAQQNITLGIALVLLLTWGTGLNALAASMLWLLGAIALWTSSEQRTVSVSLCLMSLIASLPILAAAQVQRHVLYLAYAFESVLVALVISVCVTRIQNCVSVGKAE